MAEKNKKTIRGIGLILIIIFTFSLIIGVRGFIERTRVSVEGTEVKESEGEKEELKYLTVKLKAKLLLEFSFREKKKEELLEELEEIKEELGRIEEGKIREVFKSDKKELEKEILEVKEILRREFLDEGDRQLEIIQKVAKYTERGKIKYFTARVAFSKDEEELERLGVFLLNGAEILAQEAEENINIFLGGEEGVGLTTEDLEKIELKEGGIFSIEKGTGRKVKIGEGLEGLFKKGKLRAVRPDFSAREIKTTEITLRGKATWDLEEELEAREIKGLVGEAYVKNSLPETLKDSLERLKEE